MIKPDYYLSRATIEMFSRLVPDDDFKSDVRCLAQEFLINEKRLQKALNRLARNMKKSSVVCQIDK